MTRHATTALLALAVSLAFAALGAVLLPADPAAAVTAPAVHAAVEVPAGERITEPFLVALAPASDLSPVQQAKLTEAGHLVCEGHTAEVPVPVMEETLAAQYGLSAAEAAALIAAADATLCQAPSAA